MRKPRDYDSELVALKDKAKQLKERKVRQLGELIVVTGADTLSPEMLAGALLAIVDSQDPQKKKAGANAARAFFKNMPSNPCLNLKATNKLLKALQAALNQLGAAQSRHDHRAWVMNRRERTRQLIELGGLVVKSGLVAVTNDDRALILGALIVIVKNLEDLGSEDKRIRWRALGEEEMRSSKQSHKNSTSEL
jgi:DNA-binding protein H-NS